MSSTQKNTVTPGQYEQPVPAPAPAPAPAPVPAPTTAPATTSTPLKTYQSDPITADAGPPSLRRREETDGYQGIRPTYTEEDEAAARERLAEVERILADPERLAQMDDDAKMRWMNRRANIRASIDRGRRFRFDMEQVKPILEVDPSSLDPATAGANREAIEKILAGIPPELREDPSVQQQVLALQSALQKYDLFEGIQGEKDKLDALVSRAQGEGLDDLASMRQLESGFDRAEAAVSSTLGGAQGARGQALLQARQAAMGQQEQRQRDMIRGMEQIAAASGAEALSGRLQAELNQFQMTDADLTQALTMARNALAQVDLDADAAVQQAELIAKAREDAAQKAADDAFFDQLLGAGFTAAGMAAGAFLVPGPAGAMAGGAAGNLAYQGLKGAF